MNEVVNNRKRHAPTFAGTARPESMEMETETAISPAKQAGGMNNRKIRKCLKNLKTTQVGALPSLVGLVATPVGESHAAAAMSNLRLLSGTSWL